MTGTKVIYRKLWRAMLTVVLAAILMLAIHSVPASAGTTGQELYITVGHDTLQNRPGPGYVQVCGYDHQMQNPNWRCLTWGLSLYEISQGVARYRVVTVGNYFKSYWGQDVQLKLFDKSWRDIGWRKVWVPVSYSGPYFKVGSTSYYWM
jgi:hypothetical protein